MTILPGAGVLQSEFTFLLEYFVENKLAIWLRMSHIDRGAIF